MAKPRSPINAKTAHAHFRQEHHTISLFILQSHLLANQYQSQSTMKKNGREFIPTVLLYEEKWLTIFRFVILVLVLVVFLVEEFIRRCIHGNDLDLEL